MGNNQGNHLKSIDSLRGLAAVSVYCFHMLSITKPEADIYKPWFFLFSGHEAVILFFVLSGFILTYANMNADITYKQYVIRRMFRIYPAYYFTLFLAIVLFLIIKPLPLPEYSYWFNTQFSTVKLDLKTWIDIIFLVTNQTSRIDGVIWSLVYEVLISVLLLPLMWKLKTKRSLVLLAGFYVIYFIVRQLIHPKDRIIDGMVYYSVFFYFGYLIFLFQDKLVILSKVWLAPIYIFCYSSIYFSSNYGLFNKATIRDLLSGFGAVGFIYLVLNNRSIQNVLGNKVINFYGKISYPFYLLHICIMYGVVYLCKGFLSLNIMIIMIFVLTSLISAFTYYMIEKPFIRLGKRF